MLAVTWWSPGPLKRLTFNGPDEPLPYNTWSFDHTEHLPSLRPVASGLGCRLPAGIGVGPRWLAVARIFSPDALLQRDTIGPIATDDAFILKRCQQRQEAAGLDDSAVDVVDLG
jgi:hypothetical protein